MYGVFYSVVDQHHEHTYGGLFWVTSNSISIELIQSISISQSENSYHGTTVVFSSICMVTIRVTGYNLQKVTFCGSME